MSSNLDICPDRIRLCLSHWRRTRQGGQTPPPFRGWGVQCPDPGELNPLLDFDRQISITVFADKLFCLEVLNCPGVSLFDGFGLLAAIGFMGVDIGDLGQQGGEVALLAKQAANGRSNGRRYWRNGRRHHLRHD